MAHDTTAHELGDRLLQVYDEIKAHPLREQHGYEVCQSVSRVRVETAGGMDVVSFSLDAGRYTFRCADFFISGLGGGLRSVRLGLFDEHGRLLFAGTVSGGAVEVLTPGPWVEELLRLHQQIAGLVRKRTIRDPYDLERQDL